MTLDASWRFLFDDNISTTDFVFSVVVFSTVNKFWVKQASSLFLFQNLYTCTNSNFTFSHIPLSTLASFSQTEALWKNANTDGGLFYFSHLSQQVLHKGKAATTTFKMMWNGVNLMFGKLEFQKFAHPFSLVQWYRETSDWIEISISISI